MRTALAVAAARAEEERTQRSRAPGEARALFGFHCADYENGTARKGRSVSLVSHRVRHPLIGNVEAS